MQVFRSLWVALVFVKLFSAQTLHLNPLNPRTQHMGSALSSGPFSGTLFYEGAVLGYYFGHLKMDPKLRTKERNISSCRRDALLRHNDLH